jgi:hypothetical protein
VATVEGDRDPLLKGRGIRHFNLGLYFCTVDILPGTLRAERTHEYHCDDVIAISTLTIAEQEPPQALGHDEFHFARTVCRELQVVASNGDRPTIPVMIHGHEESKRARGARSRTLSRRYGASCATARAPVDSNWCDRMRPSGPTRKKPSAQHPGARQDISI